MCVGDKYLCEERCLRKKDLGEGEGKDGITCTLDGRTIEDNGKRLACLTIERRQ
jgi:hypothetical protein